MTKELIKILGNKEVNVLRIGIRDYLKGKTSDNERMQVDEMVQDIVKILMLPVVIKC